MTIQERTIRELPKELQAKMAKLSLEGAAFKLLVDSEPLINSKSRWIASLPYAGPWIDTSLAWLVKRAWSERVRRAKYGAD